MIFHTFVKTLKDFGMLKGTKKLYIACSGGPDSTALLRLLMSLKQERNIQLGIIHLNHGLRGEDSARDAKAVQKMAKALGLHCVASFANVKKLALEKRYSIEEAAREARYDFFLRAAKQHKIDTIALGHTMNDQAETMLMRVLSGTGLQGLSGSRPVFYRERIKFIRPLIHLEKKDVLNFLHQRKIRYSIDQSNASEKFLRNRIRLKLIPFIEKNFGRGNFHVIARLPEILQADADFLENEAKHWFAQFKILRKGKIILPRKKFERLPAALQFRIVKFAVQELGFWEIAFAHWKSFQKLVETRKSFTFLFPSGIACAASQASITFQKVKKSNLKEIAIEEPSVFSQNKSNSSLQLNLGEKVLVKKNHCWIKCRALIKKPPRLKKRGEDFAVVDRQTLQFPLHVRNRLPGDLFQPLGQAQSLKLKDFLINRKIPKEKRDSLPLLLSGNKIIWIGGVGISEQVKVTTESTKFAKLEMVPVINK